MQLLFSFPAPVVWLIEHAAIKMPSVFHGFICPFLRLIFIPFMNLSFYESVYLTYPVSACTYFHPQCFLHGFFLPLNPIKKYQGLYFPLCASKTEMWSIFLPPLDVMAFLVSLSPFMEKLVIVVQTEARGVKRGKQGCKKSAASVSRPLGFNDLLTQIQRANMSVLFGGECRTEFRL